MYRFSLLWLFFSLLLFCGCESGTLNTAFTDTATPANAHPGCQDCEILFIGSSYLDYAGNNVVDIFSQFAQKKNNDVYIDRRVTGGWRLYDHARDAQTIAKINERKWDIVFLQGNAAYLSQEKWHDNIIPYIQELRNIIKNNSPETYVVYMMPWAYLDGLAWLPGETDTYEQMQINLYNHSSSLAKHLDIAVAPAGWTWYTVITNGFLQNLYLSDNNHQTNVGAYLTACVFYTTAYLERPPQIDYTPGEADVEFLKDQAFNNVINNLEAWNIYHQ